MVDLPGKERADEDAGVTRGVPSELEDALARVAQAQDDYERLAGHLQTFLYEYIKGMIKERNAESGAFVIRLRHLDDSNIRGRPLVLVSQIVESLHFALDYLVFELSRLNAPDLHERKPHFVIADSEAAFARSAREHLQYLTAEQISFIEQLQPYRGGDLLALLKDMANPSKHRHLLSLMNNTSWSIYFAEMAKRDQYQGAFEYPVEDGQAFFAKPKGKPLFLLLNKYDAIKTLGAMIQMVGDVLLASACFFYGLPFRGEIIFGSTPPRS